MFDNNTRYLVLSSNFKRLRTEEGDKPKILAISRALLVLTDELDATVSISTVTHAKPRSSLNMVIRILHYPQAFQFPEVAENVLFGLALLKTLFQFSHFRNSEFKQGNGYLFLVYVKQLHQ